MTIVITAFERSPDGGMGLARDTRVRWALEEVGQPYEVRLVSFSAKQEPAHLGLLHKARLWRALLCPGGLRDFGDAAELLGV
jgi:hypothetical protein